MQVQITEFASDSFPLSIQLKQLVLKGGSEPTNIRPLDSTGGNGGGGAARRSRLATLTISTSRKKGLRFRSPVNGTAGTSCLSIIGMIEPGRAVRLYRQIH